MKLSKRITVAMLTVCLCLPACAKKSSRKVSVEGPKNKYELKLEKSEKE